MFLAVDIGNTRTNLVLFDSDKIIQSVGFETLNSADKNFYKIELKSLFQDYKISECAIISVVNNMDEIMKDACDEVFGVNAVILKPDSVSDIKINTKEVKSVGMDRLANVYAASDYPLPAIVVDIGTAITFDILSADKEFMGGIIMPGVNMQLKSLALGTSKLPEIEPKESLYAIGNDTETCILSGVVRGTAAAIDGIIEQCIEELGDCKTIILTGGQAEFLSKYIKTSFSLINVNLTVIGIKKMFESL